MTVQEKNKLLETSIYVSTILEIPELENLICKYKYYMYSVKNDKFLDLDTIMFELIATLSVDKNTVNSMIEFIEDIKICPILETDDDRLIYDAKLDEIIINQIEDELMLDEEEDYLDGCLSDDYSDTDEQHEFFDESNFTKIEAIDYLLNSVDKNSSWAELHNTIINLQNIVNDPNGLLYDKEYLIKLKDSFSTYFK